MVVGLKQRRFGCPYLGRFLYLVIQVKQDIAAVSIIPSNVHFATIFVKKEDADITGIFAQYFDGKGLMLQQYYNGY
jgi:hypothetical protein